MFFTRSEELSQTRFIPLVVDAIVDLGGNPTRSEIIARAIELGCFTEDELAVPSHTKQDRKAGRQAVRGRLRYAIWAARSKGVLLSGDTGGKQVLTAKGRAMIGKPTGYPALDARRLSPGDGSTTSLGSVELRPYVPPRRNSAAFQSLSSALPRSGTYDMDVLDRKTVEHHKLQGAVREWLVSLGWHVGIPPARSGVLADLIAEYDGRWVVVEVKTLDNERPDLARQQLRLGLGQILDYREQLRQRNTATEAVLTVSAAPGDQLWPLIAGACDVGLAWPPFASIPAQLEIG